MYIMNTQKARGSTVGKYVRHLLTMIIATFATLAIFAVKQVDAAPTPDSCFTFNVATRTITGYNSTDPSCPTDVEIPASLGGGTNNVETISTFAFYNKNLTSVIIPDTVTTIDIYAFYSNQLTSLAIPGSVVTVGNYAFAYNQLTSILMPNSATSIGAGAFTHNPINDPQMASWLQSDLPNVLTQPVNMEIAGVPVEMHASISGNSVGTHVDYLRQFDYKFDDKWYWYPAVADMQITSGSTMTVELTGDFSKMDDFSFFFTDAERTNIRVYGIDSDGNRIDVTNWVVTNQLANASGPASRPNLYTVATDYIEFTDPLAGGVDTNVDTMRVRLDQVSLQQLKQFTIEFASRSTGDWVQWGFFGTRAADTPSSTNPDDTDNGNDNSSPDLAESDSQDNNSVNLSAPNTGNIVVFPLASAVVSLAGTFVSLGVAILAIRRYISMR